MRRNDQDRRGIVGAACKYGAVWELRGCIRKGSRTSSVLIVRGSIRVVDALGHRNVVSLIPITVSDSPSRTRQYAGLAVVIVVYLGGIVGWSWAVTSLNSEPTPPDTVQTPSSSPEASPAP